MDTPAATSTPEEKNLEVEVEKRAEGLKKLGDDDGIGNVDEKSACSTQTNSGEQLGKQEPVSTGGKVLLPADAEVKSDDGVTQKEVDVITRSEEEQEAEEKACVEVKGH